MIRVKFNKVTLEAARPAKVDGSIITENGIRLEVEVYKTGWLNVTFPGIGNIRIPDDLYNIIKLFALGILSTHLQEYDDVALVKKINSILDIDNPNKSVELVNGTREITETT